MVGLAALANRKAVGRSIARTFPWHASAAGEGVTGFGGGIGSSDVPWGRTAERVRSRVSMGLDGDWALAAASSSTKHGKQGRAQHVRKEKQAFLMSASKSAVSPRRREGIVLAGA